MKIHLLLLVSSLLFPLSLCFSSILFIEQIDQLGNFREIQNSSFSSKIPIESEGMIKAIAGYDLAQKVAFERNLRKKGIPGPSIQFLNSKRKSKPLYIEIDNGNWAYNLMNGKNFQIVKNKQITKVSKAPIIKIGRNMPSSNHKHYMGQTCSHEIGHAVMNALYSGKDLPKNQGGEHTIDSVKSPSFAWIEGFAEYYAAATYGDQQFPRSYQERSPEQLNASEGYIASVLLEIEKISSQETIFAVIADIRPQNPADFLEEYIARFPDQAQSVFDIMKKFSGDKWPDEQFLLNYQQGNLLSLDLDGYGQGPTFAKDSKLLSQAQNIEKEAKKAKAEADEISDYLTELSQYLERLYNFKQHILQQYANNRFSKNFLQRIQATIDRANRQFNSYQKYLLKLRNKEAKLIEDYNDLQDFGTQTPSPDYRNNSSNHSNSGEILRY